MWELQLSNFKAQDSVFAEAQDQVRELESECHLGWEYAKVVRVHVHHIFTFLQVLIFYFFWGRESHGELHRRGCDPNSQILDTTSHDFNQLN